MVRKLPTIAVPQLQQATQDPSTATTTKDDEAPEDSAMKDGLFQENNTTPPKTESIVELFKLTNRTAIVSGSDRGIGLRVAQAFAEAGANVAIWYHSNKDALKRAKEIQETYGVKCAASFDPS